VAVASTVLDAIPEDDNWLWDINFHGVVNGTRAFLPILVEQNEGAIVNTSSVFGLVGMPNQSAYCAAKFAVRGFTDSLRQELRGTGVAAINVHPGGINTNIVRNARLRKDPEGRTQDQMAQEFASITMTEPDKAAEIIHRGVERGKARILVGPDAYIFDTLARLAPTSTCSCLRATSIRSGSSLDGAARRGLSWRRERRRTSAARGYAVAWARSNSVGSCAQTMSRSVSPLR
jgi:short-subunit dehydrogenase